MPQPPARSLLAGAVLAMAAAACAHPTMDETLEDNLPPERPNEMQPRAKPPVPKRNPRAQPVEIRLRIENAPGPFGVVSAGMSYDVDDERCLPRRDRLTGIRVQARHSIPIPVERTGPSSYKLVAYDNLYLPEDHYGLGVCRWKLQGVGFGLRATGAPGETRFGEFLFATELKEAQPIRAYFLSSDYPRVSMADYPAASERDPSKFRPEVRSRLFVLEFTARRADD